MQIEMPNPQGAGGGLFGKYIPLILYYGMLCHSHIFMYIISSGLYEVNMESLGFKSFYVLEIMYLNRKSPYFGFWVAQKFVHGPKGSWVEKKGKKVCFGFISETINF